MRNLIPNAQQARERGLKDGCSMREARDRMIEENISHAITMLRCGGSLDAIEGEILDIIEAMMVLIRA